MGFSCNEITVEHFMVFDCSALFKLGMKLGFLVLWSLRGGLETSCVVCV